MHVARPCFLAALIIMLAVVPSVARAADSRGSGVVPVAPPRTALRVRPVAAYLRDLTALAHRAMPSAGTARAGQVELVTTKVVLDRRRGQRKVTGGYDMDYRLVPRAAAIAHHVFQFVTVAGFHGSH